MAILRRTPQVVEMGVMELEPGEEKAAWYRMPIVHKTVANYCLISLTYTLLEEVRVCIPCLNFVQACIWPLFSRMISCTNR